MIDKIKSSDFIDENFQKKMTDFIGETVKRDELSIDEMKNIICREAIGMIHLPKHNK
jgi:hypothetical protein